MFAAHSLKSGVGPYGTHSFKIHLCVIGEKGVGGMGDKTK